MRFSGDSLGTTSPRESLSQEDSSNRLLLRWWLYLGFVTLHLVGMNLINHVTNWCWSPLKSLCKLSQIWILIFSLLRLASSIWLKSWQIIYIRHEQQLPQDWALWNTSSHFYHVWDGTSVLCPLTPSVWVITDPLRSSPRMPAWESYVFLTNKEKESV